MLKYLSTASLPKGPFRLRVKCYPAAYTVNILNLKINSGRLVEFGARCGGTRRASDGLPGPLPSPDPAPPILHPARPGVCEAVFPKSVLLSRLGPNVEPRSRWASIAPRFPKSVLLLWLLETSR